MIVVLLLAAILITLLGAWGLVAWGLTAFALYAGALVGLALPLLPFVAWGEWRATVRRERLEGRLRTEWLQRQATHDPTRRATTPRA